MVRTPLTSNPGGRNPLPPIALWISEIKSSHSPPFRRAGHASLVVGGGESAVRPKAGSAPQHGQGRFPGPGPVGLWVVVYSGSHNYDTADHVSCRYASRGPKPHPTLQVDPYTKPGSFPGHTLLSGTACFL